ncbi:MAG: CPBP family intramembrane glutamic endopeptidase [Anaerolineae bacterium]
MTTSSPRTEKRVFWREAAILWAAGMVGVMAVIPYQLSLTQVNLAALGVPPWAVWVSAAIQNGILVAAAVLAGLWLARRTGLEVPVLEAWLRGEPLPRRWGTLLRWAVPLGAAGAVLVILLDGLIFSRALLEGGLEAGVAHPPAWQGLLASLYGGITEELFMRLFLMSGLAWLLGKAWAREGGLPADGAMWTANVLAAVLFGLGHLPTTAALVALTPLIVLRAIVLNGVVGVICGWLYWRKGLEMAMGAHFSADLVLHVLLPLLIPFLQ